MKIYNILMLFFLFLSCSNERNQLIGDYSGEATVIDTEIILTYDSDGMVIDVQELIDTFIISQSIISVNASSNANQFTLSGTEEIKRLNRFSSREFELNDLHMYEASENLGYTNSSIDFHFNIDDVLQLEYNDSFEDPPLRYKILFKGKK